MKSFLSFVDGSAQLLSSVFSEIFELLVKDLSPLRLKCIFQLFGSHNFDLINKIDVECFHLVRILFFYFKLLSIVVDFVFSRRKQFVIININSCHFTHSLKNYVFTASILGTGESE